ncbi:Hypothetical protein R9X50_00744500 [Acrodontium crateriforme]|uniref:Amino acid transporter n=1 Tax=Acrodontium crateriforme TaxID=150365 RepID=A0AAQ3MCE6_9PEZI|nr:Hypothetical protein R9X50_00744500 [Acrodontium crateriforme]
MSLAEMASMAPTAGGQYHWASEFAPPSAQRFISYCTGWLSTIAWQSVIATDCYIIAGIIQALIHVNHDTYEPARWVTTLITIAVVIALAAFNMFAASHLSVAEGIFATFHVFAFVPVVISLWVMAPTTATYDVFFNFKDHGGGWPSTELAALVGQVSCMFVVIGSDSVAHLSEEVEDAAAIVPQAMIWSDVLNAPLAFTMLITYCFSIGDIGKALASPYPFVYVFQNAFQSPGATSGFTVVILILLVMITISAIASTARQAFAFARDNGLPFSSWIKQVNKRYKVPVNAILLTAAFTIMLSLLNIVSTVAINIALSLSTVALMATCIFSISCVTLKRVRKEPLPPARWSLGKYGLAVNMMALLYSLWSFFWSMWPSQYHITAATFNWSPVLFVCLMFFACVLYFADTKRRYEGPAVRVQTWMNNG